MIKVIFGVNTVYNGKTYKVGDKVEVDEATAERWGGIGIAKGIKATKPVETEVDTAKDDTPAQEETATKPVETKKKK